MFCLLAVQCQPTLHRDSLRAIMAALRRAPWQIRGMEHSTDRHSAKRGPAKLCERLPQNGEACLWEMPSYRTRGAIAGEEMDLAMLPTKAMIGVAELSPIGTTTMALTGAELAITIDMVEDLMMALKFKAILPR